MTITTNSNKKKTKFKHPAYTSIQLKIGYFLFNCSFLKIFVVKEFIENDSFCIRIDIRNDDTNKISNQFVGLFQLCLKFMFYYFP